MCNIKTTTEDELKAEYARAIADKTYKGSFRSWLIITLNSWEMLHGLSKEQKPPPVTSLPWEEAVKFAEWLTDNEWIRHPENPLWWKPNAPGDTSRSVATAVTQQLYDLYKQSK